MILSGPTHRFHAIWPLRRPSIQTLAGIRFVPITGIIAGLSLTACTALGQIAESFMYATLVEDSPAWNNEQHAVGPPPCEDCPCSNGNSTANTGTGNERLRALEFEPCIVPAMHSILNVHVNIHGRYQSGDGELIVEVRRLSDNVLLRELRPTFNSDAGNCRWRLGSNLADITDVYPQWDCNLVNDLYLTVRRPQAGQPGHNSGDLLVNAFRIRTLSQENDTDGDGIGDSMDNCPLVFNPTQNDFDGDGLGDACDPDDDNDGAPEPGDNCPFHFNPGQEDFDGDNLGDACDPDDDNDGVADENDPNPLNRFVCGSGDGDPCDDCGATGTFNPDNDGCGTNFIYATSITEQSNGNQWTGLGFARFDPGCSTCACDASNASVNATTGNSRLRAEHFDPFLLPPDMEIYEVQVSVNARYATGEGSLILEVRDRDNDLLRRIDSAAFDDSANCRWRLETIGDITDLKPCWSTQDINELILTVRRPQAGQPGHNPAPLFINAFRIRIKTRPGPACLQAHDLCSGAEDLGLGDAVAFFDTRDFQTEPGSGSPTCDGSTGILRDAWFVWTADRLGVAEFCLYEDDGAEGPGVDPKLVVRRAACNGEVVGCSDNAFGATDSFVEFVISPGEIYFVQAGVSPLDPTGDGPLTLEITTYSECIGDVDLSGGVDFGDLNLVLSSFGKLGGALDGDADFDGDVDFRDLNFVLGLFNTPCDEAGGGPVGDAPDNDDCVDAQPISGYGVFPFECADATEEALASSACLDFMTADVWYRWTAPATATVRFSTLGLTRDADTIIAVYGPAGCGSAPLRCNDDDDDCGCLESELIFPAVAGQTYLLQIGGYDEEPSGQFRLTTN